MGWKYPLEVPLNNEVGEAVFNDTVTCCDEDDGVGLNVGMSPWIRSVDPAFDWYSVDLEIYCDNEVDVPNEDTLRTYVVGDTKGAGVVAGGRVTGLSFDSRGGPLTVVGVRAGTGAARRRENTVELIDMRAGTVSGTGAWTSVGDGAYVKTTEFFMGIFWEEADGK
jgi:hypothetical protein